MARTAQETINEEHQASAGELSDINTMADAWEVLNQIKDEASDNAMVVARQLGYDGTLTVGALEDEIRFYQRRTVEGVLELGKRLILLQELTPHGEFMNRVSLLGIDHSLAKKFMKATWKFGKLETFPTSKVGTQSKLLELLILDDGEIEALENGETVRGVTLDKIETLSVSELKKALRDANQRIDAKDQVIKDKSAKIDEQAEQLAGLENQHRVASLKPFSAEQQLLDARANLQATAANVKTTVLTMLRKHVKDLHQIPGDHAAFSAGCLVEIARELAILRDEYRIPAEVSEDLTPEWMKPDWEERLQKQYGGLPSVSDVLAGE